jgi:hypothetical protein
MQARENGEMTKMGTAFSKKQWAVTSLAEGSDNFP